MSPEVIAAMHTNTLILQVLAVMGVVAILSMIVGVIVAIVRD